MVDYLYNNITYIDLFMYGPKHIEDDENHGGFDGRTAVE